MALAQSHYRFGIASGTESTHGWHAAENTAPTAGALGLDTPFLVRFNVQASGGVAHSNIDLQLTCNRNGGAFQNVTTTSTIVRAVTTSVFAEAANTTKRLAGGTGTFESSSNGCSVDGLSGGNNNDIVANGCCETEFSVQIRSADVANGDVIQFRLTSPDAAITYTVTPSYTVVVVAGINADLAVTLDAVTLAAETDAAVSASLARTLEATTLSSASTVATAASLARTLDAVTLAAETDAAIAASLARTLDSVTLASAGTVADAGANAALSVTLADVTATSEADVAVTAALARTLDAIALASSATAAVGASLSRTLDSVTLSADADVATRASAAITLASVQSSAQAIVATQAALSRTLESVSLHADINRALARCRRLSPSLQND